MFKKSEESILIFILFCVQFTHIFDFVIMMPLGPKFMRYFSIGPKEFSLVVSAYAFSAAISGIVSSFFMDRFDRKNSLLFLYSGFILGTLSCAIAINYETLLLARIVAGGFGGVLGGLIFSVLGDSIPEHRRGAATGVVMSAFGVSSVIGIPTGLFLAETFDWHTPFVFLGVLSFVVLVLIYKKMQPMNEHRQIGAIYTIKKSLEEFLLVFNEPNHRKAFMLSIFMMLSGFLVIPFVSPYLVKNAGLSEEKLPYIYFFGGMFTLVTSRWIGKLSDRFGKHKMFYIVGTLSMIPITLITHLPKIPTYLIVLSSSLFFILVSGRFVPVMSIITSSVKPQRRGSFMSMNAAIQSMAAGLASLISGIIITTNTNGELVNYGLAGVLSCLLTLVCLYLISKVQIVN